MPTIAPIYKVTGNTYLIRFYLSLCGCHWNGKFWSTCDPNLKTRLAKVGLDEKTISHIKLEKISPSEKKSLDQTEK